MIFVSFVVFVVRVSVEPTGPLVYPLCHDLLVVIRAWRGGGGAVSALAVWLTARRIWRSARRLSARNKGHDQLVELGHLAGGLAHEIKNPLSTINMNLKLLSEDLARQTSDESQRSLRRLSSVQTEAARLKDILDDFLRYAGRMESARWWWTCAA